jgi:hypothetical protein
MVQLLKARHPAHKPAVPLHGTGDDGAIQAPFIREETLAKLPEEQMLASTRVLRDALESVRIEIEAAQEPRTGFPAPDDAPDRGADPGDETLR